jgi:hypothetical protein
VTRWRHVRTERLWLDEPDDLFVAEVSDAEGWHVDRFLR